MLKKILAFYFICISALGASDLVKIYLNQGLDAVGVAIEKELTNKDFYRFRISRYQNLFSFKQKGAILRI